MAAASKAAKVAMEVALSAPLIEGVCDAYRAAAVPWAGGLLPARPCRRCGGVLRVEMAVPSYEARLRAILARHAAQREALEVELGKIMFIEPVYDFAAPPGMTPDHCPMDGYSVQTDQHQFFVLIENEQSCCEAFGVITSEDDHTPFIGAELREVLLTDRALNQRRVEDSGYYEDDGGIQFVDFHTSRGVFQLSVYNAHNGYYGHRILVLKDGGALLSRVL